jgi:hypothetical protein
MIFFGIILLIAALICFFVGRGQSGRLRAINAADTFTAQMLQDLYGRVVASVGGEALSQPCEVAGTIETDAPLTAPIANTPCVAYVHTVTREYEEDVTSTDSEGKVKTETTRHSETVETNERRASFYVRDASGRVLVNPDEAELDLVEVGKRFDQDSQKHVTRTRTLGYRHEVRALPVGTQVYVLGCAVDGGSQPAIGRGPREKKLTFLISRRGERELAQAAASSARWYYYATAGSGAIGMVLLLLGLVQS